jgi:hypothetical protein
LFLVVSACFGDRISCVAHAGLTVILLSQSLENWDYRHVLSHSASFFVPYVAQTGEEAHNSECQWLWYSLPRQNKNQPTKSKMRLLFTCKRPEVTALISTTFLTRSAKQWKSAPFFTHCAGHGAKG